MWGVCGGCQSLQVGESRAPQNQHPFPLGHRMVQFLTLSGPLGYEQQESAPPTPSLGCPGGCWLLHPEMPGAFCPGRDPPILQPQSVRGTE